MKNKVLYIAAFAAGVLLASCDPQTIDGTDEWATIPADALQLSVTPIQVDGKNSNEFVVENHSGVNSQWRVAQLIDNESVAATACAKMYATQTGLREVRFLGLNNSEMVEKVLTVQVDTITYLTDAIKNRLCVGQKGAPAYFGSTFDKGKIVVEQELCADGKKGNRIFVKSNVNPVLCKFKWGSGLIDTNIGTVFSADLGGNLELTVEYLTATGETKEVSLGEYSAEDYSSFPAAIALLTGYHPVNAPTGTKTWKLAEDGKQWGNGNYGDKAASWWTTTVDGQGGSTGTMTFDFKAGTISKVIDNPDNDRGDKNASGKFALDFSTASGNIIATLKTSEGGNIVFPYLINEDYKETHTFQIVTLTEDEMWLCAQHTDPGNSEGTFWHFVPVK